MTMPRKELAALWIMSLLAAAGAAPARAGMIVEATTALGTATTIRLPPSTTLDTTQLSTGTNPQTPGTVSEGGIKFALAAGLPAGATITSATLGFTVIQANGASFNVTTPTSLTISESASASSSLTLGDFGAATGNAGTTTVTGLVAGNSPVTYSVNVTSLVASSFLSGSPDLFFQFDDQAAGSNVAFGNSLTSGTAPTLSIQFNPAAATVPEPSSLALCGAFGAGVLGVRRLRRRIAAH